MLFPPKQAWRVFGSNTVLDLLLMAKPCYSELQKLQDAEET